MIKERVIQVIENKGIAKENFYTKIGMTSANFRGKAKETPLNSSAIVNILSEIPDLNSDWLLTGKGKMLKEESYHNQPTIISEPDVIYVSKQPEIITIDQHNEDNIPMVPFKLQAGYLNGYADKNFMQKLPAYRMPGLNNGVFRLFEVEGNSMFPTIPAKSYVVGQFVENWITGIKDNQVYAIISNEVEHGFVKRCLNKIKKYNNLICKSDNRRDYPTQNIDPSTIKEVWEIKLHLNYHLPDPADIYNEVHDLRGEVESLKNILKKSKLLDQ